ncbi:metabotropic glutamate receptor 1-like [Argonauta hians]
MVDFEQDPKLGFVRKAVYTMAYALHTMQQKLCDGKAGMCDAMTNIQGTTYFKYLMNTSFVSYFGEEVHFDENGDPPGRYDIMNFQEFEGEGDENATYAYVKVGSWSNGRLEMNDSNIFWPSVGRGISKVVESVCSKPCQKGYIKKTHAGRTTCCWTCTQCEPNEILLDESRCKACSKGWWPNANLTACHMIKIEHMSWHFTEAIIAIAMACIGIITTCFVGVVFIRYNDTPVVKASTRELSYIILGGIIFALTSNFVLVAKPTIVSCYFTRIIPGLSFSCIYGALVTKTNRIARILEGSKKIMTKKPRFMSASAQVVITCLLIGIESTIITVMLVIEPSDSTFYYPTEKRVILLCNTSPYGTIVPLGFDLFLIMMCTLYAVKTRNLPENFNEAKFIGFTMYTTCVIWLGFLPIYFESESKVFTMCVSVSLSAIVALVLLFFPKVYIIIYCPEKNTRSAFTTSKDVRCHIGNTGRSFSSSDSLDGYRDMLTKRRQRSLIDRWKTRGMQKRGQTPSPNPSLMGRISNPSTHGNIKQDGVRSHSFPKLNPSTQAYTWKERAAMAREAERANNTTVSRYVNTLDESQPKSNILRKKSSHIQDTGCQTDAEILGMLLAFLRNHIGGASGNESGEKSFFSGLNDKIVTFSANEATSSNQETTQQQQQQQLQQQQHQQHQQQTATNRHYTMTPLPLSESPKGACIDCIPGNTLASEKSPLLSADDGDTLSLGDTNLESGKEFSFSSSLREFPFMLKRRQKAKYPHNESDVSEMSWMAQSSGHDSIQSTPENCLFPSVSESPKLLSAADRKSLLTPQSSYESRGDDKSCNGGFESIVVTVSVTPSTSTTVTPGLTVASAAAAGSTLTVGAPPSIQGGSGDGTSHGTGTSASLSSSSTPTPNVTAASGNVMNVINANVNATPPSSRPSATSTPTNTAAAASLSAGAAPTSNAISNLAVAALNRMSQDHDMARRYSALSWSSSSGNVSLRKSLEEMSLHGLSGLEDDEAVSMEKFIDYLKLKGIKFDETSLQSSDV